MFPDYAARLDHKGREACRGTMGVPCSVRAGPPTKAFKGAMRCKGARSVGAVPPAEGPGRAGGPPAGHHRRNGDWGGVSAETPTQNYCFKEEIANEGAPQNIKSLLGKLAV